MVTLPALKLLAVGALAPQWTPHAELAARGPRFTVEAPGPRWIDALWPAARAGQVLPSTDRVQDAVQRDVWVVGLRVTLP